MGAKRYKAYKLIPRIRSHLIHRYKVPKDLVDTIDFNAVIVDGMTMKEAYAAIAKAYPELRKYLEKREDIRKLETEVEENIDKQALLLHEVVREAEEGNEDAVNILKYLLRRAIVEKDPEAIDLIKATYNLTPGEFARRILIPRGIIKESYLNELIAEITKARPPPAVSPEYAEYEKAIADLAKEIRDFKGFLSKFTIEDLRKVGLKSFQAMVDKYVAAIRMKEDKLRQLKEKIPEKASEIERQIKRAEREIKKAKRVIEGFKPYDVEYVVDKAVERIIPKLRDVIEDTIKKELTLIRKSVPGAELSPEEWKYCCLCFYGDNRLAVKYYDNKAVCHVHARKLEEEWEEMGLKPQWNPDDTGLCTNCGRLVKAFRCSGGLIYCLECAAELSGKVLFDDELTGAVERAKRNVARIMNKYGLYR